MATKSIFWSNGGYADAASNGADSITIAVAAIALGLDETEVDNFAYEVCKLPGLSGASARVIYSELITIAYRIRERRATIANG